jgi:phospholipase C
MRVAADTGTTRSPAGKTRRWLSWTVPRLDDSDPQFVARTPGNTRRGLLSRCGYGPRLPFLLVSPWAKEGKVDHTLTDTSPIDKFIEDNWGLPRIPGSFDSSAGSLNSMFSLRDQGDNRKLFLGPTTG